MSVDETVDGLRSQIKELASPDIPQIPVDLVQNYGSKTTKLLGPVEAAEPLSGRNKRHEIRFKEPILASHINIFCEGYPNNSEFEIEYYKLDGTIEKINAVSNDNFIYGEIDNLITGISFTPPYLSQSNTSIKRVAVHGIRVEQTRSFLNDLFFIDKRKSEALSQIEKELRNLLEQRAILTALQSTRDSLAAESERYKQLSEKESAKLRSLQRRITDESKKADDFRGELIRLDSELENSRNIVKNLTIHRGKLNSAISSKTAELQTLNDQVNIFPSEISGFARQGRRDVILYSIMMIVPLLLISAVTY